VKFWLNISPKDLPREWLLDEHRSIHAYFGGMLRNPERWSAHPILGSQDPYVMYERHEALVEEMSSRGFKHNTPITMSQVKEILEWKMRSGGSKN